MNNIKSWFINQRKTEIKCSKWQTRVSLYNSHQRRNDWRTLSMIPGVVLILSCCKNDSHRDIFSRFQRRLVEFHVPPEVKVQWDEVRWARKLDYRPAVRSIVWNMWQTRSAGRAGAPNLETNLEAFVPRRYRYVELVNSLARFKGVLPNHQGYLPRCSQKISAGAYEG